MKKKKRRMWRNGYEDGSGRGTITFNGEGKLCVHWGCGCCDYFNSLNPSKEDKKLIRFADRIVKLLNENKIKP